MPRVVGAGASLRTEIVDDGLGCGADRQGLQQDTQQTQKDPLHGLASGVTGFGSRLRREMGVILGRPEPWVIWTRTP